MRFLILHGSAALLAALAVAACGGDDAPVDDAQEALGTKAEGSGSTARARGIKPTKCARIKQEALGGQVSRVRAYNLPCRTADRVALPFVERDERAEGWTFRNPAGCEWFAFRPEDAERLGVKPRRLAAGGMRALQAAVMPIVQFGRYTGCRS